MAVIDDLETATPKGTAPGTTTASELQEENNRSGDNVEALDKNMVVASKNVKVKPPWVLVESKTYEDRCFFFNRKTKESAWVLDKSFILAEVIDDSPTVINKIEKNKGSDLTPTLVDQMMKPTSPSNPTTVPAKKKLMSLNIEEDSLDTFPRMLTPVVRSKSSFFAHIPKTPVLPSSGSMRFFQSLTSSFSGVVGAVPSPSNASVSSKSSSSFESRDSTLGLRLTSSRSTLKDSEEPRNPPKFKAVNGLGVGAFSIVLKVEDVNNLNRSYAMKKIKKANYSHSWKSKRKLKTEIEIIEELSLSCFIASYDYIFENTDFLYLVTEQMYGDLYYHLSTRKKPKQTDANNSNSNSVFTENECQILLAEICLALEHVHNHHFVHRDVKLENILIDEFGHIKLHNFDQAIRFETEVQPMGNVSSQAIMPPELIKYHTGGRHTDWWAYGLLAHELLTGNAAFTNSESKVCLESNELIQAPSSLSKAAGQFICHLLHPDYKQRLGTVLEDIEETQSVASGGGSVSSSSSKRNMHSAVRKACFFKGLKWKAYKSKTHAAAFIPSTEYCISKSEQLEILREHQEEEEEATNQQRRYEGEEVDPFEFSLMAAAASEALLGGEDTIDGEQTESTLEVEPEAAGGLSTVLKSKHAVHSASGSGAAAVAAAKPWSLNYPDAADFLA